MPVHTQQPYVRTFHQYFMEPDETVEIHFVSNTCLSPSKKIQEGTDNLFQVSWTKLPDFGSLALHDNPDGTQCRRLTYEVHMNIVGMTMDLAIYYKGQRMGSHNVAVDHIDPRDAPHPALMQVDEVAEVEEVEEDVLMIDAADDGDYDPEVESESSGDD